MKKILSIDGGGTRGIVAASFLEKLELNLGHPLREEFDLIAGTSAGGIISLCLGNGISASAIRELFELDAGVIFPQNFKLWRLVKRVWSAEYSQDGLKKSFRAIKGMSGTPTLLDIDKWRSSGGHRVRVMAATFDMSPEDYRNKGDTEKKPVNFRPRVYYSNYFDDHNEKLEDIVCQTSAGPIYFPIYQHYVDGGVAINHPAMSAVSFAMNEHDDDPGKRSNTEVDAGGNPTGKKGLNWLREVIRVLSVGTGTSYTMRMQDNQRRNLNWGFVQWFRKLVNMITETNVEASEYYVSKVLPVQQYMRIQHDLSGIDKYNEIQLDVTDKKILQQMKVKGASNLNLMWPDIEKFLSGSEVDKDKLRKIL